ncbi:MAG: hypothetical protein EZS28_016563 [Streblomastix strix]|uniref:Uncharacterized protein n=1 Tax=Streblomastix strix TaxID=222440 RepID=A0A5J4VZD7_9EUKA|nr:MAG: hypothetical protein EZS28_016563 [Streblomastix strix]
MKKLVQQYLTVITVKLELAQRLSETYAKDEVYSKTEADELLNAKVDKTDLIDIYQKTKTDEILNMKADKENVAKLTFGDNFYIDDEEVANYWWDGTNLRVLETELSDMSNVITTLGAATRGCNAIIDISIDGNSLM